MQEAITCTTVKHTCNMVIHAMIDWWAMVWVSCWRRQCLCDSLVSVACSLGGRASESAWRHQRPATPWQVLADLVPAHPKGLGWHQQFSFKHGSLSGWTMSHFGLGRVLHQQDLSRERIGVSHLERKPRSPCFLHPRPLSKPEWPRQTKGEFCHPKDSRAYLSTVEAEHFQDPQIITKLVKDIYAMYEKCSDSKRGSRGNDLLNKLDIPSPDLETLGCPQYEVLRQTIPRQTLLSPRRNGTSWSNHRMSRFLVLVPKDYRIPRLKKNGNFKLRPYVGRDFSWHPSFDMKCDVLSSLNVIKKERFISLSLIRNHDFIHCVSVYFQMCWFSWSARLNLWRQWGHGKGLSQPCRRTCWFLFLSFWGQWGQEKAFSPTWSRACFFMFINCLNGLVQWGHEKGVSPMRIPARVVHISSTFVKRKRNSAIQVQRDW